MMQKFVSKGMVYGEQRLICDHQFYWGRTLDELPQYAKGVVENPLRIGSAATHVIDGVFRTTSDIARVFQSDRRPIKPLSERSRVVDSLGGAASDALGGVRDLTRGKVISFVGKEVGAFLQLGDAAVGLGADAADLVTNMDSQRKGAADYRLAA